MSVSEDYEEDDVYAIVIDLGSHTIRVGWAGEDKPEEMRTLIGHKKSTSSKTKNIDIADEDIPDANNYDISAPIRYYNKMNTGALVDGYVRSYSCKKHGVPQGVANIIQKHMPYGRTVNWNDTEILLKHAIYNKLKCPTTSDRALLLTEPVINPKSDRLKITEIAFESFNVPSFFMQNTAILSMYSCARCYDRIIIEYGYETVNIVPVLGDERCPLRNDVETLEFGGKDLTLKLLELLKEKNIPQSVVGNDFINSCKSNNIPNSFKLPDGNVINLSDVKPLFKQFAINKEQQIAETVRNVINKYSDNKDLYYNLWGCFRGNMLLFGGGSMVNGIGDRLVEYIKPFRPTNMSNYSRFCLSCPPERKYSAWIGASIVGSLSTFYDQCITKSEYDECGPVIVIRKCF